MKLIIGLGNPGKKYDNTRHNTGFMALDLIARELNISVTTEKFKGLYGKGNVKGIMRMRNLPKWKLLHGEGMVCRSTGQKEKTEFIHFKLNNIPHKGRLVKVRKKKKVRGNRLYFA